MCHQDKWRKHEVVGDFNRSRIRIENFVEEVGVILQKGRYRRRITSFQNWSRKENK